MALDKQKKEFIIIGVGLLLLVVVVLSNLKPKKKSPPKLKEDVKAADTVNPAAGVVVPDTAAAGAQKIGGFLPPDESVIKAQLKRMSNEQPLKDPFYPLVDKVTSKRGSLVLKGVSWKENGASFAVINQEIVKIGDTIGDSKVVSIEKKSVTLEKDGQKYILVLEE